MLFSSIKRSNIQFNQVIEYLQKVMDFWSFAKNMGKNIGKI